MKQKDISVIIPVYNVEKYISECIESVLSCIELDIECICVNDSSTDGSKAILDEYSIKDPRVIVINNASNLGLASTRNVGIRKAKGKYIYLLDSDDYLIPGALETMFNYAEKDNLDFLGFTAKSFFESADLMKYGYENEYVRKKDYDGVRKGCELFAELITEGDKVANNIVLYFFNREFYQKCKLYCKEGVRYADDSMFLAYMNAGRVKLIQDQLYMRRYREGSACTSKKNPGQVQSMILVFIIEFSRWEEFHFDNVINSAISKYFLLRLGEIKRLINDVSEEVELDTLFEEDPHILFFYRVFIKNMPNGISLFDREDIKRVKEFRNIVVYGAGKIASDCMEALRYHGVSEYEIAVSSLRNNPPIIDGHPVRIFKEMTIDPENTIVIIAVSKRYQMEIKSQIELMGNYNMMLIG